MITAQLILTPTDRDPVYRLTLPNIVTKVDGVEVDIGKAEDVTISGLEIEKQALVDNIAASTASIELINAKLAAIAELASE